MLFAALLSVAAVAVPPTHPVHKAPRSLINRIARSGHASAHPAHPQHYIKSDLRIPSLSVSPADYGGDPTGVKDSTEAVRMAIAHCLNQSALSPNGLFPGSTSFPNNEGVRDMGGCEVNLQGGEFKISQPLLIPEYNANMIFGFGSIVAAKTFSAVGSPDGNPFLIIVGVPGSCKVPQGSCNIDINFPELFLDGSHVASGMQISNVMGVTVGPGGYMLNFTSYGIQINKGHEVMVDRCWLGETNFDYDYTKFNTTPTAIAIQINGNDHYVLNTIVFSSMIGIEVNGAADYITGTHVWFPMNRALAFMGPPTNVMAFHVTKGGNRFNGCYADGGRCVFEEKATQKNIWTNGFECCAGAGLGTINHGIILKGDTIGPGLQIYGNLFGGGSIWHEPASPTPARALGSTLGAAAPVVFAAADSAAASSRVRAGCQYTYNITGLQCTGMTKAGEEAGATAAACQAYCCKLNNEGSCSMWQWSPSIGCYVDPEDEEVQCGTVRNGGPWIGAAWSQPPSPNPNPSGKTTVTDTRIEDNNFIACMGVKCSVGSRASSSVTSTVPTTTWQFDFCDNLVFKHIELVRGITVTLSAPLATAGAVSAWAQNVSGCTVTVKTSAAVAGTVFAEVDSSAYGGSLV